MSAPFLLDTPSAEPAWEFASLVLGSFIISTAVGLLASLRTSFALPAKSEDPPEHPLWSPGCLALLFTIMITTLASLTADGLLHEWASATAFHKFIPKFVPFPVEDWKVMVFLNCGALVIAAVMVAKYIREQGEESVLNCVFIVAGGAEVGVLMLVPVQMPIHHLFFMGRLFRPIAA